MNDSDMELLRTYAEQVNNLRKSEATIKKLKENLAKQEESIRDLFLLDGIDSMPVKVEGVGVFNLHIRETLWTYPKDHPALAVGLREYGWGDLVSEKVNTSQLSSHVRDLLAGGGKVPDSVADFVTYDRKQRVICTKKNKKESLSSEAIRQLEATEESK